MIVVRGNNPSKSALNSLKEILNKREVAVTIGNFDGVHLGHSHIYSKLANIADTHHYLKVLITFEPSPKDYFARKIGTPQSQSRLTLLADKLNILKIYNFDLVWVINFNHITSNKTAHEFIDLMTQFLDIKSLLIGRDFRFGKDRKGDVSLLQQYSKSKGYQLEVIDDFLQNEIRVSSSVIRDLLTKNDGLDLANKLLARNYGFSGRVIHGQKNGRLIGFPTINIHVKPRQLKLPRGVYAVKITIGSLTYYAMANWGVRPTVANKLDLVLEANIFDFSDDLYDQKVYIEFCRRIRAEKKFSGVDELKLQLENDKLQVQQYFMNLDNYM